jgi:type VI secretion system secreted protein Hcp
MQVDGIDGSATDDTHTNWIPVDSFQWGVGRAISSPTGGSSDRESSVMSVSEVVITKEADAATVKLMDWCFGGSDSKTVKFDFVATGKEDAPFLQYELDDTLISGYSQSSGGDRPMESITLNFIKIMLTVQTIDPTNNQATPSTVGWDIAGQHKL